ncbi:MAG: ABC transporter ATP-binding protein/permease [Roseburia sp.]|nr:ABC transporter ATP-binding protein/permease [Roseburia sp.]MCM1235028.1 ABC transporter ATP-binding protein/permease [Ruminococcus flavefaciens]
MKNVKTFFSMFGKLVRILNGKQKRDGMILFFLLMVVSLLEMLGVGVIVPFIITMLEPDKIMSNQYIAPIVDWFEITDYKHFMYVISGGIIVIYALKNAFILYVNYFQSRYRNRLEKDLNVKMLSSYMKRPYTFFLRVNSAEIIRGVSSDITNVASVVDGYSGILAEGLTCLVIGIFLICMSPFMALSLLAIAGITALVIIMGFKGITGRCGVQTREAFAEKFKHMNQAVNGIKEIAVAQRKQYFVQQFAASAQKAADSNTKYLWISKAPSRLIETVFIGSLLIVVTISYGAAGNNLEFVTALGAIGIAAVRILPSVSNLTNAMNGLVYMRPSLEAAYDNLMEADRYQQTVERMETEAPEKTGFNSKIRVSRIAWRYQENLPLVLEELDLEICKGEAVALIGESGAGKSTLADILLGLLKPESGSVTVDGTDIFSIQSCWSRMIGYVPQMVFLIDDTVRRNIAFGIPEQEIEDEKVWHALEQAQMKTVVEGMDGGLDAIVGERGIKLSGGQRQRIAIARALYHDPDILILDEATSALDSDTESAVMEAIDALQGRKTLIIIAHRLSTIQNCDRVYEIRDKKACLHE